MSHYSSSSDRQSAEADEGMLSAAMSNWETILTQQAEIATEYDKAGWETVQIRPGEVQLLSKKVAGQRGFYVLVPDDKYRIVKSLSESGTSFNGYEVYKTLIDEIMYLVIVLKHVDNQTVLIYPVYYQLNDASIITAVEEGGEFRSFLRRLEGESVEVTHEEPGLLSPDKN
jgi:hypothetical protein